MSTAITSSTEAPSRFAGALIDLLDRVEYRRVSLKDQFDPVYRLRYEAYRRENFVPINSQRISTDSYDSSPNAYGFGVYIDGQLVSSIRFHHVTPQTRDSPSRSIWPEVLNPILDAGHSYIDPSRFTADHEASLAYPALSFLTLRIVAMASVHFDVSYCLASVRPEHAAFYKHSFQGRYSSCFIFRYRRGVSYSRSCRSCVYWSIHSEWDYSPGGFTCQMRLTLAPPDRGSVETTLS